MKQKMSLLVLLGFLGLGIWVFIQGFGNNPSLEFAVVGGGIVAGIVLFIVGILLEVTTRTLQKMYYWLTGGIVVTVAIAVAFRFVAAAQNQSEFLVFIIAFPVVIIAVAAFSLVRSWRRRENMRSN